ncbi:MAG: carboxypeptidase-like regulatory domain-containing protein, partial [Candidatus Methanoperedens sp.]|nr:carboxypeptidase-like regulatory domain-containing protein [Candidatus Methanoperedens sp.]
TNSPIVPEDMSKFNISGSKINASDGSLVPGWNITLKKDLIETSISTNETGFYEFKDLLEGTYTVFEEQRPGWRNVTAASLEITGIDQDIRVNFENMPIIPTYNISGFKFNASDGSGISGWNITIIDGINQTSTLTDSNGHYQFTNLVNGTYTVFEELRSSDWTNVTPSSLDLTILGEDKIVNF